MSNGTYVHPNKFAADHGFSIRWMIRRDMPEVLAMDADMYTNKWDDTDYIGMLRNRNCIGMVVEHDQTRKLVGSMVYSLRRSSLMVERHTVALAHQEAGIVEAILWEKLKDKLSWERRNKLFYNVPDDSQYLAVHVGLRNNGWRAIAIIDGCIQFRYLHPHFGEQ